jgi:uncharacterized repeat protein (TIGR04076 family)
MFKVKCTLIAFEGDEKTYPCHFNYKIGDEFFYDGVNFTGRICPGLLAPMMPMVHGVFLLGNKYFENVMYRYRGHDARDAAMKKYDGAGFRPLAASEATAPKTMSGHFVCGDSRTLAHFTCEAVDIADSDYAQPFYRRELAVLEKIRKAPGIQTDDIINWFTPFEREKISPPLTPVLVKVLLDALADMNYIEIREGRAYATQRQPPCQP